MANPSLKAQIEAAKSALASDLAASSLVTPSPKQPIVPIMAGNDIATDAGASAATPIPANPNPPISSNISYGFKGFPKDSKGFQIIKELYLQSFSLLCSNFLI